LQEQFFGVLDKMRIIHITGPIGSGKTTLDMSLRNELGALDIKGEVARNKDVVFIGRIHKKYKNDYSDKFIKFGGLDDYLRKDNHDVGDLLNEIKKQEENGAKYCVMAGIRDFKKYVERLDGYEFYEVISLRGAKRVLAQRIKRRKYPAAKGELKRIEKEIDSYDRNIARWEVISTIYPDAYSIVFNKSMLFTERMETMLNLMSKPVRTNGHYRRKFY